MSVGKESESVGVRNEGELFQVLLFQFVLGEPGTDIYKMAERSPLASWRSSWARSGAGRVCGTAPPPRGLRGLPGVRGNRDRYIVTVMRPALFLQLLSVFCNVNTKTVYQTFFHQGGMNVWA